MARVTRNPVLPRLRVPVLYVPAAMEQFARAVQQEPDYSGEVVNGYIAADIYWNRADTWQTLIALWDAGVIWMPADTQRTVWQAA